MWGSLRWGPGVTVILRVTPESKSDMMFYLYIIIITQL